ncbi:uncharacterized protein LOC142224797 [Haematobia irritans]|uniref:uncharacterized protein LOC142224797 n=1 Tax=Haematobia irritans TaxID=7368 RepID=UPI003F4FACD8
MPGPLPQDMEFDVAEVEASTSHHHSPAVNNDKDVSKTKTIINPNDRKRQRLESALSPINISIPDLTERLANHNPADQNRFGILGVLSDIDIGRCEPEKKTKTSTKCVKCNLDHEPGECLRTKEDQTEPFCNNCGETGHPANWRGCPTYKKHIKLITFNVRSLNDTSRQLDLTSLLSHNKIDIGFIQECHLRRNRKIRINGYNIITDNSPVGTAVVTKNCINFRRVYLNNIGMNTCLAQIDFITSGIRKRYLFGSVYIPCNHPTQTLESDLDKLLQFCKTFDAFVLGGDLNSKDTSWGDSNENSNGRTLHSWLGSNLLDIIRICDRAPSYPNGSSFLDHFLVSTQLIDTSVAIEQANKFKNKLGKINPGPSAFKQIYQVIGKNKHPFCNKITHNNCTITNATDIADHFKNFYTEVFRETIPQHPVPDLVSRVTSCIEPIPRHIYSFNESFTALSNTDSQNFTTTEKIKIIIQFINNKKSSGMDGISNFILKKFPESTAKLMAAIFNNCINNCYFPNDWKKAKILPIKKKSDSTNLSDFRPISLLSNVGKIFENVIKEKLENNFIVEPIPDFQFGFKKSHGTQHALIKFHNDIIANLRNKTCTVAISLDIEKAFDSACHKGILYKLVELGTPPHLVKLIDSFLTNRQFSWRASVLAPYLFNIFLNDFPHTTADSQAILYADDCLIYAHSLSPIDALQKAESHLCLINEFYQTWGIKINAAKSQAICIRNASGKCHRSVVPQSKILQLFLEDTEIPFMETIKYLGVNFNYLLKFNDHGRNSLQKAKRVLGSFSYIMNSRYLPQKTKLLLYKVAIRPLLTYGFPIWFSISPIVIKELEIFERKILRKCINKHYASRNKKFSNKHIYDVSEVKPFSEHAFNLHMTFVLKLATHENDLVKEIYDLEKHTYWSGSTYLSSIAIINENTSDNPDHSNTRRFYHKIPRTHRG